MDDHGGGLTARDPSDGAVTSAVSRAASSTGRRHELRTTLELASTARRPVQRRGLRRSRASRGSATRAAKKSSASRSTAQARDNATDCGRGHGARGRVTSAVYSPPREELGIMRPSIHGLGRRSRWRRGGGRRRDDRARLLAPERSPVLARHVGLNAFFPRTAQLTPSSSGGGSGYYAASGTPTARDRVQRIREARRHRRLSDYKYLVSGRTPEARTA